MMGQQHANDLLVYTNIPINVVSSGDLCQLMTNVGRDNYDGSWCYWCNLSKEKWKIAGHQLGTPWTIPRLKSHLESIKNSGTKKPSEIMGVRRDPLLPAIDVSETALPILHLQLGVINKVHEVLVLELQAAAEVYSWEYINCEIKMNECETNLKLANCELHNNQTRKEQLQVDLKNKKLLPNQDEQKNVILELRLTIKQCVYIKLELEKKKMEASTLLKEAKQAFQKEASETQNSKAEGQKLRSGLEALLKEKHGIDQGVYFGGDFQGNDCRKFMTSRKEIFFDLRQFILDKPEEEMVVEKNEVVKILNAYEKLVGHFDGLFSICRIKRYHTTTKQMENLALHVKHATAYWRALGLSVTPKIHCIEDHLCDIVHHLQGLGDLGEDEGERGHQTGHRNESRTRSMRDIQKKVISHLKHECMSQNLEVKGHQDIVTRKPKRRKK